MYEMHAAARNTSPASQLTLLYCLAVNIMHSDGCNQELASLSTSQKWQTVDIGAADKALTPCMMVDGES